jgi:hypothetical protein
VAQEAVSFERDIRPLFRDGDINSMSAVFDLSSYEDVRANSDAIYEQLAEGSFRAWIDTGFSE